MTTSPDEDARLTALLRALPLPPPQGDFLAGARRRYLQAMEARYRREAVTGIVAASLALALVTALLLSAFEPASLIAAVAVTIASLATWMDGIGIVVSQVPPLVWISAVVASVVSLLSVASLRRARLPAAVK